MRDDLRFETEIVVLPTVREESGLAMSSRNELLSPDERAKAGVLYRALKDVKTAFKKVSERVGAYSNRAEGDPGRAAGVNRLHCGGRP
jgi:pantothenate synthetase